MNWQYLAESMVHILMSNRDFADGYTGAHFNWAYLLI